MDSSFCFDTIDKRGQGDDLLFPKNVVFFPEDRFLFFALENSVDPV